MTKLNIPKHKAILRDITFLLLGFSIKSLITILIILPLAGVQLPNWAFKMYIGITICTLVISIFHSLCD